MKIKLPFKLPPDLPARLRAKVKALPETLARVRKRLPPAPPMPEWMRRARQNYLERQNRVIERARTIYRAKVQPRIQPTLDQVRAGIVKFEPQQVTDWASRTFQQQNAAFYGNIATVVLSTYFVADLAALVTGRFIPEPPPVRIQRSGFGGGKKTKSIDDYAAIFKRNLFNSQGFIPGEEMPGGDGGGIPIKTTLPFNLLGTLIFKDELKSIATIEDRTATTTYPVRIEDEIPSKAKILKIEPRRVVFVNLGTGRREYVDLPEDTSESPRIFPTAHPPSATGGIERVSANQYSIARSEVDRALADLNNVLTQARAVPNFENGLPAGYKLFQIVPGSIYDKLGLRNFDVITGVDGQTINDPGKAIELLNSFKDRNHLDLQIKRDGKSQTMSLDITR